ncbi:MAG: hypothetical protein KDK66_03190 [Deltaproteobacteria bacterium]|nr:hypothetical protein [Deltaproteobacteria bacterium]
MKKNIIKKTIQSWILIAGLVVLSHCGGGVGTSSNSEVAPQFVDGGAATTTFVMGLSQSSPALATSFSTNFQVSTLDQGDHAIEITAAWLNVDRIEIKLPGTCEDLDFDLASFASCETELEDGDDSMESEIHVQGPYVVDLVNGLSLPEAISLEIASGSLDEVEVKVEESEESALLPEGVPSGLAGNTLLVEGTVLINEVVTPFSLTLKFSQEIEFKNLEGVLISENADLNEVFLNLDVSQWFANLDLETCFNAEAIPLVEGVLMISEESTSGECSDIEDLIKENIKTSGSIDDSEDDESHPEDNSL